MQMITAPLYLRPEELYENYVIIHAELIYVEQELCWRLIKMQTHPYIPRLLVF